MKDIISDAILAAMICNHKTFFLVTCNCRQQHQQKNNNQQVVHESKKPTDSSNNSMKGVKTSILSGPLNSMALGPLFLDECDDRQQGQERTASNMAFTITAKNIEMECFASMEHNKEQPSPVDNLAHP